MSTYPRKQWGGSTVFTIIIVAILGYGAFIGIQYVPQWTEARSVQSILDSLAETQRTEPVGSQQDIQAKVIRMLQVNEMNDMVDAFKITRTGSGFTVRFEYDRELNLGWEKKTIHYDRMVQL